MKLMKIFSTAAIFGALFVSFGAKADMVTDAHGNVGYDTAAECDAAVAAGTARFYTPFTHKAPLKRQGEAHVQVAKLKDLGDQYNNGACDVGVGRRMGREGVSTVLQGKYIPFDPQMPVNVYTDQSGNPMRVTMAQCDNWFSNNAPRPVALIRKPVATAPVAQPAATPVVAEVVKVAPVLAPVAKAALGATPYVFGTLGALNAGTKNSYMNNHVYGVSDAQDTRFAGQVGLGAQFNQYLGAELFYTPSATHEFDTKAYLNNVAVANVQNYLAETQQHTYGARLTLGKNLTDAFRLFAKGGVAGTTLEIKEVTGGQANFAPINAAVKAKLEGQKDTFTRGTVGIGATYQLNDKLAVRGDYDHYFKKNYHHDGHEFTAKGKNYVGVGVQYNFR